MKPIVKKWNEIKQHVKAKIIVLYYTSSKALFGKRVYNRLFI